MKRFSLLLLAIGGFALVFAGCTSTNFTLEEFSPSAVISIIGNTQVPWVDHDEEVTTPTGEPEAESTLTSLASQFTDSKNPELMTAIDRLDYVYDSLAQNLPELTGIEVLSKDDVIKSETYEDLRSSYFNMLSATKKATGYKDLTTIGGKTARVFFNSIGAKSGIIVSCTFQKDIAKGSRSNGMIKGIATLKIKLLNEKGKEVLNKIYASDTEAIKIVSGDYNKDELVTLLNDAIDAAIRQFCIDISKDSVESATPLQNEESKEDEASQEVKGTAIKLPVKAAESY